VASLASASKDLAVYGQLGKAPVYLLDSGAVPVSIMSLFFDLKKSGVPVSEVSSRPSPDSIERWSDESETRSAVSIEQATLGLKAQLIQFLSVRVAGIAHWFASNADEKITTAGPTSGENAQYPNYSPDGNGLFRVSVRCNTKGIRIFASPAYFIDWLYFGFPSSPVVNHLLPGRYLFGTDAISTTMTEDRAVFQIPASYRPELKRF
jgi:hypothetical protein